MTTDEKLVLLQAEVTALKSVVYAIFHVLGGRDISLGNDIISSATTNFPKGEGNVVVLDPRLEAVQIALENIQDDLTGLLRRD